MDGYEIFETVIQKIYLNVFNIFLFLILLAVGFVVGKVAGRIVEVVVERSKIENRLFRKKIFGLSTIFSVLVSWTFYLVFFRIALDFIGILFLSQILEVLLTFLGKSLLFIIAFLSGYAISLYLKNKIEESEIELSKFFSRIIFYIGIYSTLVLTLPILGIDTTFLSWLFLIVFASVLIPFSIALGFALKDELKELIKEYIKILKKKKKRQ